MKKKPHPASIRKSDTSTVKDAMKAMLQSYNLEKKFDETNLVAAWYKIMGKAITSRTEKVEIRNGVMVVSLSSAPLKHELNNSKAKVLDIIEKEFGRRVVKDVLFI